MTDNQILRLSDKNIIPTEELIFSKRTMLWAGILNDTFRITFWFGDKAVPLIEDAVLPPSVKDEFRTAKKIGAVRPVSVIVREQADADIVLTLLTVKSGMK